MIGHPEQSAGRLAGRWPVARAPALVGVVALLAAMATAAPAHGFGGRILSPSDGQAIGAGETLAIRWSALAADVDEMELLLSVDGGRSYPLRLTRQLDPRTGSFDWIVPNLPTDRARLRVRYGRQGAENDAEPGGVFRIVGAPLHAAGVRYHAGEWWTGTQVPRSTADLEPHETRVHCPGSDFTPASSSEAGAPEGRFRIPPPLERARTATEREPAPDPVRPQRSSRPLDRPRRE